jgi:mannose-6-phosphate isomerase-like protein (cupin superfamily)
MSNDSWRVFDVERLAAELRDVPVQYREFLRVPTLSCGLYRLAAGARDMQAPHDDDEVYYVLEGRAKMRLGGEERSIGPGSLLFVGATESHSFFEIESDMTLLVFFAAGSR